MKHFWLKISRYEFWSFWVFYIPMLPLWFYYSLKSGSPIYFTLVNPKIKWGGFFNYSKSEIQKQIPDLLKPQEEKVPFSSKEYTPSIPFPLVAKPDQGERGKEVTILYNLKEWQVYHKNHPDSDIILQEYITLPKEFGVFYCYNPQTGQGEILSVTGKEFLTYEGDGKISLREFIEQNPRAFFRKSYLYLKFHDQMETVLPKGEKMVLEEIGNHCRGTFFYDASDLITDTLTQQINHMANALDDFYYGRMDVKSASETAFKKGELIVLEVNGANSEATHIYDPKFNLISAYQEVIRHLKKQYKVVEYQRKKGLKFPSWVQFGKQLIRSFFY